MAARQIPNLTPVVFLSPTAQLEIVQDGTTYRAAVGQIADLVQDKVDIKNDTAENNPYFPLFSRIKNGQIETLYASDPHYNYTPFQGLLSVLRPEATQGIVFNNSAVSLDYTFPNLDNATSCGPLTLTAAITVPTGSEWMIL